MCPILVWNRVWFRKVFVVSIPNELERKRSVICDFEVDFKKRFSCGFNLSNGDIISVLFEHVMLRFVTASRSENGYGS